jgi:ABC-type protease/lipase transport system fused ATPase/permease subunit
MKVIIAILAGLALATFPVYLVVFMFKSLVLGIMVFLASVIWMFSQLFKKLSISKTRSKSNSIKLLRR